MRIIVQLDEETHRSIQAEIKERLLNLLEDACEAVNEYTTARGDWEEFHFSEFMQRNVSNEVDMHHVHTLLHTAQSLARKAS